MIFVAVGTTDFNALIEAMDRLSLELSEKVVMQTGRSRYQPQHCEHFRFTPSLDPYYEQASLVVSHGGLGIITEVMNRGLPLVAVEDVDQPGRHQQQLLEVWSQANHLVWCRAIEQLPEAIKQAKQGLVPYQKPDCSINLILADYITSLNIKK